MTDEQIQVITGWMAPMTAVEAESFSDSVHDVLEGIVEAICETEGHQVDNDHCGKPEHRRCWLCGKSMPHAPIALQVKANETTASKAVLPSESLGEGSILDFDTDMDAGSIMYGISIFFTVVIIAAIVLMVVKCG